MIAAIYTVLHTRRASLLPVGDRLNEYALCLNILVYCSSPITSGSQPGDMAEQDTRWKPLADAIALAEDAVIRTLQSPEFRDRDNGSRYWNMTYFFRPYQDIGLEQLARRVSEKMLHALAGAVQDLHSDPHFGERSKHGLLEWLDLLEKERHKQMVRFRYAY